MKKLGTLILLLVIAAGCADKKKKVYKPESLGAINTLAVVMESHLWESEVGDKVREHFAAPVLGLSWEEPLFSIDHMPQRVFTGTTRHRRAVLFVSLDSLSLAHVKTDLYARPQKVAVVKGTSREELINNLEQEADNIIAEIRAMELEHNQSLFLRSLSKDRVLREKFGITLSLPSIYKTGKQEDNFVWIDREIQKGTMNLLAYEMPLDYFDNDTTLIQDIVRMRDSIGQQFIPGPDLPNKTTYMVTEKAFAPYVFSTEIGGRETIEVRGIWEVMNYAMAGPFLTYIIRDEANDRNLVLEGFAFAPSTNKRDYMFELEAILKTVKFRKSERDTTTTASL